MTLPLAVAAALWNHRHVSERESAHYWPDGRWDNAAWEDCFWDTLVEFVRETLRATVPATHAEAEALRADSREDTSSGSNPIDGNRGLLKRYGIGPLETHTDAEVLAMPIGFAATVAGSMGVFPFGHSLRRFDAEFRGLHRWFIVRLSGGWWKCDPLAPGSHQGEWVSRTNLAKFMGGFPGGTHYIRPLLPKPAKPAPDPTPIGKVRVIPGWFHLYDVNGNPTSGYAATTRTRKNSENGFSADVGVRINKLRDGSPVIWGDVKRDFVHVVDRDSAYDGAWLDLNAGGVSLVEA